jgi:5-methylcytosine-specific restriction endonuclease McrA
MSTWNNSPASMAQWRKQRMRILIRDNYVCQIQGPGCTGEATHVDHLVPRRPGVIPHDSQLQASCEHCNICAGSPERRNPKVERPTWLR